MMAADIFNRLSRSRFRSSFRLGDKEIGILKKKGLRKIRDEAVEILNKRIRIKPMNDGRQTPFKNHPVFIAQHACAACCRKCLSRWHGIDLDKELADREIEEIANMLIFWINKNSIMALKDKNV